MRFLAIDLGSSFIKGAVLDLAARSFDHVRRRPFPGPLPNLPPPVADIESVGISGPPLGMVGALPLGPGRGLTTTYIRPFGASRMESVSISNERPT